MKKIFDLLGNFESLEAISINIAFGYLQENEDYLISTNQSQMYRGKDANSQEIRPKYSEDPYFKTPLAAWMYARWKMEISYNPERDIDTPNLFINGYFYQSIFTTRSAPAQITFATDVPLGDKIEDKYKTVLGITPDNMAEINQQQILPLLQNDLKKIL